MQHVAALKCFQPDQSLTCLHAFQSECTLLCKHSPFKGYKRRQGTMFLICVTQSHWTQEGSTSKFKMATVNDVLSAPKEHLCDQCGYNFTQKHRIGYGQKMCSQTYSNFDGDAEKCGTNKSTWDKVIGKQMRFNTTSYSN